MTLTYHECLSKEPWNLWGSNVFEDFKSLVSSGVQMQDEEWEQLVTQTVASKCNKALAQEAILIYLNQFKQSHRFDFAFTHAVLDFNPDHMENLLEVSTQHQLKISNITYRAFSFGHHHFGSYLTQDGALKCKFIEQLLRSFNFIAEGQLLQEFDYLQLFLGLRNSTGQESMSPYQFMHHEFDLFLRQYPDPLALDIYKKPLETLFKSTNHVKFDTIQAILQQKHLETHLLPAPHQNKKNTPAKKRL